MADPFDAKFTNQNPIVAAATRIRAQREIALAADSGAALAPGSFADAESGLDAFGQSLAAGAKRLNAILGERSGVKYIRLKKPLRVRLRFAEKRVSLDLEEPAQLVRINGLGLDGEWQFDPDADVPALINLSKISTEAGYGERLTPSALLKLIASDAELPRPSR